MTNMRLRALTQRKGVIMNIKLFMLSALGFMGLQAADPSGIRFTVEPMPPMYNSSGQASAPTGYACSAPQMYPTLGALQQLQLDAHKHESTTDTHTPSKPGHRRQRSLSENDAKPDTSINVQIQELPSLSQAPMQKLLTASLALQKIAQDLVEAHHKSLKELESTPGTNIQVRQAAEQQLPRARERVDKSTAALEDAIKRLTTRMQKAKK